jgi:hypothetical protein
MAKAADRNTLTYAYAAHPVWCKKSDDGLASSFAIKIGSVNVSFRAMEYATPIWISTIGS